MVSYPLKDLEAQLYKVVAVHTSEIETEEGDCKGLYVWRDSQGEAYKWGPTPISYEFHPVATIAEADHIDFLCPLCFERNGGAVGTHCVMVTFANRDVPAEAGSRDSSGTPSRWQASGETIDNLVLSPSVLLSTSQCGWHGWVGCNGNAPGHAG